MESYSAIKIEWNLLTVDTELHLTAGFPLLKYGKGNFLQ